MELGLQEMAREELRMLEAQHPNHFDYLKLELKSLISQPNYCFFDFLAFDANDSDASDKDHVLPATQESSNRKRKADDTVGKGKREKFHKPSLEPRRAGDRTEIAIKRAEECLRRIQQVKLTFFR